MKKLNAQQMEKFQGGRAPATDPWSQGGLCYRYLSLLLKYGYDPGDLVGGYWSNCNS